MYVCMYVCVCCAYVGLNNRLFSIYCTKKCHVLCEVWHCTLIHFIKLCELHHCTHTQKHTHTRAHTTEFSHSILACTGNRVSSVSFCDVQTVEFELLTHIPHFRLFQWRHKIALQHLAALFPCNIPTSSASTHAVLHKKCKILSEELFLTSTLNTNSEFCKL